MKQRYGKVRISPEMLDIMYSTQTSHLFFSSLNIIESTIVYDLTNAGRLAQKSDIKYYEYFCTSPHFEESEPLELKCDTPFYACKMSLDDEGTTGMIFRKRTTIRWEQVELEDE